MSGYAARRGAGGVSLASSALALRASNDEAARATSKRKGVDPPDGLALGVDFPMVCENCLGEDTYVRMVKEKNGAACKISKQPFNVFRWKAGGRGGRYKKTIVCYEIAAEKNICQACLVDMEYGLPVAVRDSFLKSAGTDVNDDGVGEVPVTEVNQHYYFNKKARERAIAAQEGGGLSGGKAASSSTLLRLARTYQAPYDRKEKEEKKYSQKAIRDAEQSSSPPPPFPSLTPRDYGPFNQSSSSSPSPTTTTAAKQ